MTEPEGFLSRWSRRKQEATEASSAPAQSDRDVDRAPPPAVANGSTEAPLAPAPATGTPVDLAKLPPIESITSATDIRAFLAPGVPVELTRAALRRAWTADPAIRDFIGLAENQWDFTAPGGAPGFGPLPDTEEIRRLLARVIGEGDSERGASAPAAPATDASTNIQVASSNTNARLEPPVVQPTPTAEEPNAPMVHRNNENVAPPDEQAADMKSGARPRHGGALPR